MRWTRVSINGRGPTARALHSACYVDGRFLFIFGGFTMHRGKSQSSSSVYVLDIVKREWMPANLIGDRPANMAGAIVAHMPSQKKFIVCGSVGGVQPFVQTLSLENGAWTRLAPSGNFPRTLTHASGVLVGGNALFVFGGEVDTTSSSSSSSKGASAQASTELTVLSTSSQGQTLFVGPGESSRTSATSGSTSASTSSASSTTNAPPLVCSLSFSLSSFSSLLWTVASLFCCSLSY